MKHYPIEYDFKELKTVDDDGVIGTVIAMVPKPQYGNVIKNQYGVGGTYFLVEHGERSEASHKQYFAAIREAFSQLPETIAPRFPSPTHLRKWVLIEVGLFDEKEIDCDNPEQAMTKARYLRTGEQFVRIIPSGNKIIIRRAKSQSYVNMPHKDEFQKSKQLVLDYLDDLIGVERGTLWREGGQSA